MLTKPSRILVCVAATMLFAATSLPVRAGNWGSSFDPSAPLGFFGSDVINISGSDCLPGSTVGGFFYVNGFGENNCTAALVNATVTLTTPAVPPYTDTLQLPPFSAPAIGSESAIWGVDIAPNGTLLGVDSFVIGPESGSTSDPLFEGNWYIALSAQDGECAPGDEECDPQPPQNIVTLSGGPQGGSCSSGCIASVIGNTFTPVPVTVPEPASLGLLIGALGAGWLTRRHKAAV